MAKTRKTSSGPTLPGLGGTLQFGGVQLKPMETGKGGWGGFMEPRKGEGGRQASLWDRDEDRQRNPKSKGARTMAKKHKLPPRKANGQFRKRKSGGKRKR